jgi:hypothetical protein
MIHQDLSHHPRGQGKKVRTVLPLNGLIPREAQIGFVNQGGWLQRMGSGLARKGASGDSPEFFVDQRDQSFSGIGISLAPTCEQFSDRLGRSRSQRNSRGMKDLTASYLALNREVNGSDPGVVPRRVDRDLQNSEFE